LASVTVDAVVLAGGPTDELALQQPGAPNKAFVTVGGIALVARVLEALRASPSIRRIVVVAPPSVRDRSELRLADELRPDGPRITDSLRSGLNGLPGDDPVLVVTSDLPVLTPRSVDDFVERALALDPDVGYGCVEKRVHVASFPAVPHTWARMRDGTYCGAGLVAMKPRSLALLERFIERLGAARKHPLRLASLFGWDVLARFALGRLSIAQAEARASNILGAPVRAIVSPYAETAVNVDRVSDIALAETLVRAAGPA
jgi:GTP:adenosylcobinamide-phosphate guanylyltransferase